MVVPARPRCSSVHPGGDVRCHRDAGHEDRCAGVLQVGGFSYALSWTSPHQRASYLDRYVATVADLVKVATAWPRDGEAVSRAVLDAWNLDYYVAGDPRARRLREAFAPFRAAVLHARLTTDELGAILEALDDHGAAPDAWEVRHAG